LLDLAHISLASEKGVTGKAAALRLLFQRARLTQREFRHLASLFHKRLACWTISSRTLGRLRGQVKVVIGMSGIANRFATIVKPDIAIDSAGGVLGSQMSLQTSSKPRIVMQHSSDERRELAVRLSANELTGELPL
jgi:hypothetical protein